MLHGSRAANNETPLHEGNTACCCQLLCIGCCSRCMARCQLLQLWLRAPAGAKVAHPHHAARAAWHSAQGVMRMCSGSGGEWRTCNTSPSTSVPLRFPTAMRAPSEEQYLTMATRSSASTRTNSTAQEAEGHWQEEVLARRGLREEEWARSGTRMGVRRAA